MSIKSKGFSLKNLVFSDFNLALELEILSYLETKQSAYFIIISKKDFLERMVSLSFRIIFSELINNDNIINNTKKE